MYNLRLNVPALNLIYGNKMVVADCLGVSSLRNKQFHIVRSVI